METERTLIIAEAGVNHNGDINLAKQLVDVAKEAGADVVKFQTAKVDSLVTQTAGLAQYQTASTKNIKTQREMLQRLLLDYDEFYLLAEYCKEVGIEFLSTPFDIESIHFLKKMVNFWKIPSGEVTNLPYLKEIAGTGKDIVMSTGMCDLDEIMSAIEALKCSGAGKISLLHCTTEYPAPYKEINLRAIQTLKDKFGLPVGYSDHTLGVEASVAAVALGATIIEKHFTLDRDMDGPDHKASLEPQELYTLVQSVRNVEAALGDGKKGVTDCEKENRIVARKSIVAKCQIKKGEELTESKLTTKRPGTGISPMQWYSVLGTKAVHDFKEDDMIEL